MTTLRVVPQPRPVLIETPVLGMLIFVVTETMFFAGLISAFMIVRSSTLVWPPPGQPRLPLEETALNTAALLLSGVMLFVANRGFRDERARTRRPLIAAVLLGAFFVIFQGYEWVSLIRDGLTLTSSQIGSFFYLIVGLHALHAVAALIALVWVYRKLQRGQLMPETFHSVQVLWYFVVGLWPLLYLRVYL